MRLTYLRRCNFDMKVDSLAMCEAMHELLLVFFSAYAMKMIRERAADRVDNE